MPIKTVLVNLDGEEQASRLTEAAITIAKSFSAHLVGLHVVPNPFISSAVPPEVVGELIEAQRQAYESAAKRIAEVFAKVTANASVAVEWRKVQAQVETVASVVMRHGNVADLVVLGQPNRTINLIDGIATTEEVMLGLGRPVLVIPNKGSISSIGKSVLLAWNASRESARAVFDALPFLERAEKVRILAAGQARSTLWGSAADDTAPTAGIEGALARHGIGCSVTTVTASGAEVAGQLISQAQEHGCDLIVMGGYGHWRVREVVFGGATRGALEQMTIPVLMSH